MIFFIIWRLIDFIIAYFSTIIIPYLGFFPYKEIFADYKLPSFITNLANFDGAQYLLIVREGYYQFTQAYFPLYPLLVKLLSPLFLNNHLLTGLLLSNICFLIGLLFFWKYLTLRASKTSPLQTIIFLMLFPTSFFFGALYTEGLFFLLVVLVLWGLQKNKYWLVAVAGFLAALTRFVGVFLIVPIGFHILQTHPLTPSQEGKKKNTQLISNFKFQISRLKQLFIIHNSLFISFLAPLLGLLTYMLYLWKTTGDPLFFFNTQPVFGANRSTHLIFLPQVYYRYLKIFLTATPDFQYFISVFEFLIFNFSLIVLLCYFVKSWQKLRGPQQRAVPNEHWWGKSFCLWLFTEEVGLIIFSFVNLLLPTLTGTFSSIPRYALMSLSVFIYLGSIKQRWVKIIIGCLFGILHILCLGFFIQGYFIG